MTAWFERTDALEDDLLRVGRLDSDPYRTDFDQALALRDLTDGWAGECPTDLRRGTWVADGAGLERLEEAA